MRLIDADALRAAVMKILNNSIGGAYDGVYQCLEAINNAPTVDKKPFALFSFDKEELNRIVDEQVIKPIENGELVLKKEERPQGEWLDEQFVAFHLTCNKCGCNIRRQKDTVFDGEYNYNFCPNCGADMRGGRE